MTDLCICLYSPIPFHSIPLPKPSHHSYEYHTKKQCIFNTFFLLVYGKQIKPPCHAIHQRHRMQVRLKSKDLKNKKEKEKQNANHRRIRSAISKQGKNNKKKNPSENPSKSNAFKNIYGLEKQKGITSCSSRRQ